MRPRVLPAGIRPSAAVCLPSRSGPARSTARRRERGDRTAARPAGRPRQQRHRRQLQSDVFDSPSQPPDFARYCLLHRAHTTATTADPPSLTSPGDSAERSRRRPHGRALTDLVGELATRSDEFRTGWARRPPAPARHEAVPPRRRRRHHPELQHRPAARRCRTVPDRLHRRAWDTQCQEARRPGQLREQRTIGSTRPVP